MCRVVNVNKRIVKIFIDGIFTVEKTFDFEGKVSDQIEDGKKRIIIILETGKVCLEAMGIMNGCNERCRKKEIDFFVVSKNPIEIIDFPKIFNGNLIIFKTQKEALKKEVRVDGKDEKRQTRA